VNLDRAIEDYLAYLDVERGLAGATIRAYRGDLRDFATSVRGDEGPWDRSADPAVHYLAARTRRGHPGERALAPTSLRRRAAALKGFYRFAFGEGLIQTDVATHLDLPRQSRRLPDTLDVGEVERLLEAASLRGVRDRALLELLYAAGLRISEAIGLDLEDLSLDGAYVRVIGKGDKERLVPIGEVSIDHLRAWLDGPRGELVVRHHVSPVRGGPLFLGDRGRRLARQ
jgi:integrase/recombinase XerD